MDNLDRTNVAQAAFAKWTLNRQLRALGILNEHESIDAYDDLIKDFRESAFSDLFIAEASAFLLTIVTPVWSDHANEISTAYSGTGALKVDFTRTGKRTKVGLLEDGYKSVMRYLKNNFFDGARQVRVSCRCGTLWRCS